MDSRLQDPPAHDERETRGPQDSKGDFSTSGKSTVVEGGHTARVSLVHDVVRSLYEGSEYTKTHGTTSPRKTCSPSIRTPRIGSSPSPGVSLVSGVVRREGTRNLT